VKLDNFKDVLTSIQKNNGRNFHLLLGNGFSMAYDKDIFSYNALHDFITKLDDENLSKILSVIESKNFELIMQQLGDFSVLIDVFDGGSLLKSKVDYASEKLKSSLLDAVKSLHPEHVFSIPEEKIAACSRFIKIFLDSGGKIFSTNYDILLYWVLMRTNTLRHCDGFGRELENPGEFVPKDEQIWSELIWGKNREEQNIFYIHGALPFFDTGVAIVKEEYDQRHYLLDKISNRMERGEYPVFVTAGNAHQKLSHIMHNHYLTNCYDNLCNITGSLVTFGFNFGSYDEHIIDAINRAAKHGKKDFPKLLSVYIGVYSDEDRKYIEQIESKFMCKVHLFDTKSVDIWNGSGI